MAAPSVTPRGPMRRRCHCGVLALVAVLASWPGHGAVFESLLERRDQGVVRQRYDFSCGVAALATILTYHYGDVVGELALLRDLQRSLEESGHKATDRREGVSFADLAEIARRRSYLARGLSISMADLGRLRQPVIVALAVNGRAHFSVLERVDDRGVYHLADPSWGNRRVPAHEFRRYFARPAVDGRSGRPGAGSRGRMLLVLPGPTHTGVDGWLGLPRRRPLKSSRVLLRPASLLSFGSGAGRR